MNQMPGRCPVCSSALTVTRLQCGNCGTGLDGAFGLGRLQALSAEQVRFVEVFIKCRGKIKDVEDDLGISYPTVVARLNEVVKAMGYEVDESDTAMSEVDQFEFYQAQALKPQRTQVPPTPGLPPMAPVPPTTPAGQVGPVGPLGPAGGQAARISPEKKQQILDDLAEGKIGIEEAMKRLNG